MTPEIRLAPVLVRQDGLVTLAQAVDAGVSSRTVQRRVRAKEWQRVLPRVFLVAGHPHTDAARVRAAGHVSFTRVYRAYCRNLGAHGSGRAGELLVAAADRADSAAERRAVAILRAAGITGWVLGHPFGTYLIDIAFPAVKIAIEIDGWAWHMDVDRFRADRHKGNALVRGRWELLRFTWHDLTNRPDYVVAEVRAALTAAAGA